MAKISQNEGEIKTEVKLCDFCRKPLLKIAKGDINKKRFCNDKCRADWWTDFNRFKKKKMERILKDITAIENYSKLKREARK